MNKLMIVLMFMVLGFPGAVNAGDQQGHFSSNDYYNLMVKNINEHREQARAELKSCKTSCTTAIANNSEISYGDKHILANQCVSTCDPTPLLIPDLGFSFHKS